MPLYDFKCDKCNKVEERICSMGTRTFDCDCGGTLQRQVSLGTLVLDGTDPKNATAYERWGRIRTERAKQWKKQNS